MGGDGDRRSARRAASAGGGRSSSSTRRWQVMQWRAKGSASRRLSPMVSPQRSQLAEGAVVDLLQRGDDVAQQTAVAVAQLEEELPVVGGVRLVAEILDRVVFLILAVGRGATDPVGKLPLLVEQLFLKLASRSFSSRPPWRCDVTDHASMRSTRVQDAITHLSTGMDGASPHKRSSA